MASKFYDLAAADKAEPKAAALEDDLLLLLHDVARQTSTFANAKAQTLGVTQAQLIILARLERRPDVSQTELADAAEVTPMTVARLVDRLEERCLVERRADPKDRRVRRLRLTPAALPILREMKHLQPKLRSAATDGIDPSVLEVMALGLNRMRENISGWKRNRVARPNLNRRQRKSEHFRSCDSFEGRSMPKQLGSADVAKR
jgi:MarR family transcriptional regulator, transcriptional regulator for hemolysin